MREDQRTVVRDCADEQVDEMRRALERGQTDEGRRANRDRPAVARMPQRRHVRRDRAVHERVHEQHRAGEERDERQEGAEREQ